MHAVCSEFGWTITEFYDQLAHHPEDVGALIAMISYKNRREAESIPGNMKMGDELKGSEEKVERWSANRFADSDMTMMGAEATLRKAGKL